MEDCLELSEWRSTQNGNAVWGVFALSLWERTGVRAPDRTVTTLAKHYLRPAGKPCGYRAEVIAPGNRDPRQLFRQRFLDER